MLLTLLLLTPIIWYANAYDQINDEKYNFNLSNPQDQKARRELDQYIQELRNMSIGVPSFRTGDRVAEWTPDSKVHPENLGDYLEGDILIPRSLANKQGISKKYLWPKGIVYYKMFGRFTRGQIRRIERAMRHIRTRTKCIRFKRYTGKEPDYVSIESANTGCWSAVGKVGGKQILNLQAPNCVRSKRVPVHELCHAIGLPHEHARSNRDKYVRIRWNNIKKSKEKNFKKSNKNKFKAPYSYYSIMHYPSRAFSRNGRKTIRAKKFRPGMGWSFRLNRFDVWKIRALYRCRGNQAHV